MRRSDYLTEANAKLLASLVQVRAARGLTQDDVAKRLGVTQPTIASFERMDSDPKLSTVRKYAHAVEALVRHVVEQDTGQLLDERQDEWTPDERPVTLHGKFLTYRALSWHTQVATMWGNHEFPVDEEYMTAAESKPSDFALGA
ncbi:helix-turn-helix domain-containing protein [Nesterenkonia sp. NBAIMH1]|uniref:helix-turn-helix domain-containing protein n=1 Tax=Nesterenkonia sp. NBAIMH1 TaxID=2600320 RepID=UPI0011B6F83F|nr:helix-turn-helix transcriptional regulator [Nesterenkonia sp. NBAIMH1]